MLCIASPLKSQLVEFTPDVVALKGLLGHAGRADIRSWCRGVADLRDEGL
jgi:hypothetical protein